MKVAAQRQTKGSMKDQQVILMSISKRGISSMALSPIPHIISICNKDISIAHQGIQDIRRHSESKMHKEKCYFYEIPVSALF